MGRTGPVPEPERSAAQLLEVMARRVVTYRLAMVQVMSVLRPRTCPGCRMAEYYLLDADIDRPA